MERYHLPVRISDRKYRMKKIVKMDSAIVGHQRYEMN
jgi:hypothetical protein